MRALYLHSGWSTTDFDSIYLFNVAAILRELERREIPHFDRLLFAGWKLNA